jgi:hypothetical protein
MDVRARPGAPLGRAGAFSALCAVLLLAGGAAAAAGDGAVSGRVSDDQGRPLQGAVVWLLPGGPNTTTAADGTYRLEAPPGHYLLRVSALNRTEERTVDLVADEEVALNVTLRGGSGAGPALDPFPFLFLGAAMVAVVVGGFYVNKRMSETGLAFDKSVMGGAPARKPFRRRRRRARPPSP